MRPAGCARFSTATSSGASGIRRSRVAAAVAAVIIIVSAVAAPWLAPHDPFDLASLSLLDATDPPAWLDGGNWSYPLGTDNQGRDVLSAILYGTRLSLLVGVSAVVLALLLGVTLGLVAGWRGGLTETLIMRVADVQLSFPAILIALLIDGVARSVLPREAQGEIALYVLIAAIALSTWVQYARTVRGSTLVERNKEYIQAARVIGVHPARIVLGHLLPNVLGPVLVIATINLALAILTEATLSFLGVGLPPTAAFARHADPCRQRLPAVRRLVDFDLPRRRARLADPVGQPARRLAPRRPQPKAALMAILRPAPPSQFFPHCHSGAARRAEPGTHEHRPRTHWHRPCSWVLGSSRCSAPG